MTDCESARRLVGHYLDDELVGEELHVLERHLASCQACAAAFEREAEHAAEIRSALGPAAAPDDLRDRVRASLAAHRLAAVRRRRLATAGSLAAALLAVAVGGYLASLASVVHAPAPPQDAEPDLVHVAVDSHLRYARGQLPLEVRSERPDEVSRWFSGRVPFHVELPDYPVGPDERKPYTLEGGRLVALSGDYAAFLAYRMEDRPISLLMTASTTAQPSGADTVVSGGLTFHIEPVAGLEVITWTDNGLTYALVSDLDVGGERPCLVCHGAPDERGKITGF